MNNNEHQLKILRANTAYSSQRSLLEFTKVLGVIFALALFISGLLNGIVATGSSFREGITILITQSVYAVMAYLLVEILHCFGNIIADISDGSLESKSPTTNK